jgi:phenylpyruvate tautomerase PptA (4-oxalocrotonate tautomerase family)
MSALAGGFVTAPDGVAPEHLQVFIQEVDHENWAKAGVLAVDR